MTALDGASNSRTTQFLNTRASVLCTFQLPCNSRSRSTSGSASRFAMYPGSAAINAVLSVSLAAMNVTDFGGIDCQPPLSSGIVYSAKSSGLSAHLISLPTRTNQRNTPERSGIGVPVFSSIHHEIKPETQLVGSGLHVARTYGRTPHMDRLRLNMYQNCAALKCVSSSKQSSGICEP